MRIRMEGEEEEEEEKDKLTVIRTKNSRKL